MLFTFSLCMCVGIRLEFFYEDLKFKHGGRL
jgi:hypothetical protein